MSSTIMFPRVLNRDPLFRDFDRLFNAQLNALSTIDSQNNEVASAYWGGNFHARLDLTEADDGYHIHADLPGVNKDEINVATKDGILTISGERSANKEVKDEQRHIVERSFGKFSRTVRLPNDANFEKVSAKLNNGVLELVVAKKSVDEGIKKISIQ
ncbi:hypothetical protein HK100_000135 [Physocladia obscura]|uniref:SHSP domain-containing protein n=1 Tax=Physocladia obscura TaxID=109957 RepID=A0AAD5XLT7_9FUNG|nr:hypothetical protein HK100_000135 [Physocladia obscura]